MVRRVLWRALPGVRRRRGFDAPPWPPDVTAQRRAYASRLADIVSEGISSAPPVGLHVFSFSAEERLPEQVASLRSFLANAGTPAEFTIVSDGSHTERSCDLLRAVHPCVTVASWRRFLPTSPRVVRDYAAISWRGQKLAMLVSLPGDRPVLYTDDDILFFAGARELGDLAHQTGFRYLRDCNGRNRRFLDRRLLHHEHERQDSVNSGFLFLPEAPDWRPALRRLEGLVRRPRLFSGQTVVHLTMHSSGAQPFDRSRYVLADDDRGLREDRYIRPDTVLRHYVRPVRHKFWIALDRSSLLPSDSRHALDVRDRR